MICEKHKCTLTYRAGKENVLFCKQCERKPREWVRRRKSFWGRIKFW